MPEWPIGQFMSQAQVTENVAYIVRVQYLFVMEDNSSKVVSLKVYCLHCTGSVCQFKTNVGLEGARVTKKLVCKLAIVTFLAAELGNLVSDKQLIM